MISAGNDDHQPANGEPPFSPMHVTGNQHLLQQLDQQQQCSSSNLSRSSAISVCSSGNLSSSAASGSKCMVTIIMPGCNKRQNSIELVVDLKSRLDNVLSQVAVLIGLVDVEFFGLAVKSSLPDDEFRFVELDTKVQAVIPRDVLKGLRRSTSGFFRKQPPSHFSDQSAVTLYLRVVCYVDNPALIRDCIALQLYYDQLRENALEYGQLIVPESCFTLAALALQADQQPLPYSAFFDSKSQTPEEVQPQVSPSQPIPNDMLKTYIPDWLISSQGAAFISMQLPRLQQELSEMSRVEAQLMYCRYASQRPFHHNIHMYGIKRKKTDCYYTLWIGVGFRGVDVFEDVEGRYKKTLGTFDWASIAKIQTNGKSIDMKVVGGKHKYTYFTDSEERAANLLRLVRLAHQLQLQLTRTTDSRLQITPAFRQDFPTLRRVLHAPQQENTPSVNGKVPVVSNGKPELPPPPPPPKTQPGCSVPRKNSMPDTPGWAPSVLDGQPNGTQNEPVKLPLRPTSPPPPPPPQNFDTTSSTCVNIINKQGDHSPPPSPVAVQTQQRPAAVTANGKPREAITKCMSLDLLNSSSSYGGNKNDDKASNYHQKTSATTPKQRLGASSESHLFISNGSILPVRL